MRGNGPFVALLVVVVVLLGGTFWARVSAPCSAFKYTSVQHVPARCLGVH